MAVVAANDVYLSEIHTSTADQFGLITRHWLCTATGGASITDIELVKALDARITAGFKSILCDQATYNFTRVRRVRPIPPTLPVDDATSAGPGTDASEMLPKQVSGIISHTTQFAGKRYRGRNYIPFPTEDSNDTAGIPTNAYLTTLTTWKNVYFVTLNVVGAAGTATFEPVIYHRDLDTTDRINGTFARSVWATQRRRGDFGRTNQ